MLKQPVIYNLKVTVNTMIYKHYLLTILCIQYTVPKTSVFVKLILQIKYLIFECRYKILEVCLTKQYTIECFNFCIR